MQYIEKSLCLEFNELVPSVMSKKNYDYHRGNSNIEVFGYGGNGRNVFIKYESLSTKHQAKVLDIYGYPYKYAVKQPILNCLKHDQAAQDFYNNYILPNGLKLPASDKDLNNKPQINYVSRYTTAANWLNMLQELTADKTTLKKEFGIGLMAFWEAVFTLLKANQVSLPKTRKHLLPKLKEYTKKGYEVLVDTHKFGNSFSAKVSDELAQAYLFKLLSLRNKIDYTEIAIEYNKFAVENGYETITPEAVGYRAKMWHLRLKLERDGLGKTVTKYSKQIQRKRPSAPLLLINGDDNVLDIFYKTPNKDYYRPSLYVVIDTFNDYILGYAFGDTITVELVKEAYRNANRHIMELTGGSYKWQQLQTDRWAISGKNTTPLETFYRNTTNHFTPAQLKNSQSKYIERSFGTTWHQTLKKMFPHNYSGHNLTAKQKLNPDTLKAKNFPVIDNAAEQIHFFIEAMRRTSRKDCDLNRQQEWLQAFKASEKSQKYLLSEEERLQIFGIQNLKRDGLKLQTNKITSKGIEVSILGEKHVYELSQMQIAKHIGTSVNVVYDTADLNHVLITDGEQLRFIAYKYRKSPAALADYEEGDAELLRLRLNEKKILAPYIQGFIEQRDAVLDRAEIDAESRLQAGVLVKEVTHKDQQLITATQNGAKVIDITPADEEEEINPFKQIINN